MDRVSERGQCCGTVMDAQAMSDRPPPSEWADARSHQLNGENRVDTGAHELVVDLGLDRKHAQLHRVVRLTVLEPE